MVRDRWRYACVECGRLDLRYNPSADKEHTSGGRSVDHRFTCRKCGARFDRRYDKKTEQLEPAKGQG